MEDDYDRQHTERQVYPLPSLVPHILLELQKLNQLIDQYDHADLHRINEQNIVDNDWVDDQY